MPSTDPNVLAAKATPGKADDFLAVGKCISLAMADAFQKAEARFLAEDGNLSIKKFEDYTALINFIYKEVYVDVGNCLGGAVTPKIQNQIVNAILQLIGLNLNVTPEIGGVS